MARTLCILGFVFVLIALMTLRAFSPNRWNVKPLDAAVAAVPVILGLLASGSLEMVRLGPDGVEVKRAFKQAMQTSTYNAIARPILDEVHVAGRVRLQDRSQAEQRVNELIRNGTQALVVRMGRDHVPDVIDAYLTHSMPKSFFRYIIVNDDDGRCFGILPAESLVMFFAQAEKPEERTKVFANQFSAWLNSSAKGGFRKLPGFVAVSISPTANRFAALKLMDQDGLSFLPVVRDHEFVGVLDRSRLVASVLVDVADDLGFSAAESEK